MTAADATLAAGALSGLRVLDLTDSSEQYCGRLLAQLGADVTLVEPPRGTSTRHRGPFLQGASGPNASLLFNYLNLGKSSVVADLETEQGRATLHALARQADVLIESRAPAENRRLGLDYAALRAVNERLVVTSITPFGQDGPYAGYQGDDLVAMALGGFLYLGGYADREPVGAPGDQALLAAAQFAAVATAIAVWDVERHPADGQGRHIDVSVQESISMGLETAVQFAELEGTVRRRQGGEQRMAGMGVFPCKDGQIYYMAGGVGNGRFWQASTEWLLDEQVPRAAELQAPEWWDRDFISTSEAKTRFYEIFTPFSLARTKAELYEQAQQRRLPLCPMNTPADVVESTQLAHRNFFTEAAIPSLRAAFRIPGAPFQMSATPCAAHRVAPELPAEVHAE
ncbi:succinyl-CoA--benzylsuccinate CoA-transferase [Bordetella bronchiseptica]|uniref:Subunit of succinyl-CoA:benzylsuccinate CoA-transferase n=1 Tax=Bordetella bronchiseptica (strain ATCC BAA-588 / NCTC 13252 / RB50) TaxID=257310 RepID=A0A0H3LSC5_BORBR|nr:succinyl-CoA--benzylsuccinate CoA-transferase [Bordetella bronchiseptica]KAK61163.1 CoA-transferase family III protein [Bordetella bronchiseptica 980-2]KDD57922.1 CoA-transferase family III protein [Bordetella bronchiseptica OSU553]AMG90317.1 succinyl-CoA--benzylsuccinate CoA-transferase [Bordetella bronchiseptica]KCV48285.1 CoA-transferase family III protein [Bordetella bronchiseptica 3E44]KCV57243.1 CoA-transferase family III protein [Bordetella bronchiseptica 980]